MFIKTLTFWYKINKKYFFPEPNGRKRSLTRFTLHGVKWVILLMEYKLIYLEPTPWFLYSMLKSMV
jgi:hypothetical protein